MIDEQKWDEKPPVIDEGMGVLNEGTDFWSEVGPKVLINNGFTGV